MGLTLGFADDSKPRRISVEQFGIGGATLGADQVQELISAFGEPIEIRSEETEAGPDTAKTYIFEGVEAYTQDDEVLNIECTNPAYTTPDGAKVGDTVDTVFKIYGSTDVRDRGDGGLIGYSVGETSAALLFHIIDDRVSKIELWLDYT